MNPEKVRIGVVGTGFISRGFVLSLLSQADLTVSKVLTRRNISDCTEFPEKELLTNSSMELIDNSDLILECSGDAIYSTDIIDQALQANLPVVTMNSEFHVTSGAYFVNKGFITEAEGDQPGSLAALHENVVQMGFRPIVYGNIKGFFNPTPTMSDMEFWAQKQGISLTQVTSFTDGSKLQIEQVLVANGLNASIIKSGLLGPSAEDVHSGGTILADYAKARGQIVSDYILSPNSPKGVFIVAEHDERQEKYLQYYGLGEGPYYLIVQNYHLCHLEIVKTIRRVIQEQRVLLNNSERPLLSVAAIAKADIPKGTRIQRAIGSFEFRGQAIWIKDYPNHIPIGLLANTVTTARIERGQVVMFHDVEISDSLALKAWNATREKAICI